MKIIEALKELPVLQKRIRKQAEEIQEYAALHNKEESPFGTPEQHRQKVNSLVSSNLDLADRYNKLKRAISETNNKVTVVINGETKTIAEWIAFRRDTYDLVTRTYRALNTTGAERRATKTNFEATEGFKIDRMYDESYKNNALKTVEDTYGKLDGTLEVVNATTELVVEV